MDMGTEAFDLGPYLKMISPSKSVATMLQDIHYISPSQIQKVRLSYESEEEFCTKSNIEECLRYMDKECQILGLQSLYNNQGSFDITKLVNVAHRLLRKYQQSGRYREELESRVHRSTSDLEHSQNNQKRLRSSNKSLQNTLAKYEETERQLRIENSNSQLRLKTQHDEVKKLKSLLQSTDNQYKHELKKKERQLMVIKERTQQLLVDRSKSSVPSLEISECLGRSDGRRSKWRNESSSNRNEEDMYNAVMSNFERRCTALQSENSRLRELLADVQQELIELTSDSPKSPAKSATRDHLQLPVDMIHQRLSDSLRKACGQLRTNVTPGADLNSTFIVEPENTQEKGSRTDLGLARVTTELHDKQRIFDDFDKMSGAKTLQTNSPIARSPRKSNERISKHLEQVRLAVEEQSTTHKP